MRPARGVHAAPKLHTQGAACGRAPQVRPAMPLLPLPAAPCADPEGQPPLSELGWDPLLRWPSGEEFAAALAKQRRVIKALLLDQVGWGSGEGRRGWLGD